MGFKLYFGFMVFIPFLYSLTARFLYLYPNEGLSCNCSIALVLLVKGWLLKRRFAFARIICEPLMSCVSFSAVGLVVFRGSNWQKSEFRKNPYNPELSHLSSIPTATGKRLLCSGWWGLVRHPNYAGDIMMALAWSLPCGKLPVTHGIITLLSVQMSKRRFIVRV